MTTPLNSGIEAARFVLAAAVVLFHWNGALPSAYLSVDLFFVISGLVIGRRYEAAQRNGGSALGFAVGRAIRLYPLYALGLAAGLVSHAVEPMVTGEWSYSAPGLAWRGLLLWPVLDREARPPGIQSFPFDVPAWSLWCEVLANLLFCLLCRLPRWAMAAPVALGFALLVAALDAEPAFSGGGDGRTVLTGLGRIGFSFFAGVLLGRLPERRLGRRAAGPALVTLLGALLVYLRLTETDAAHAPFILVMIVLVFPALTFCIAACELPAPSARWCVAGGSVSYALYILHWPLERVLRSLAGDAGLGMEALYGVSGATATLLLLTGVAFVATRRFDVPVRRALNALRARPRGLATPPPAR